jgi:hypothetical protein
VEHAVPAGPHVGVELVRLLPRQIRRERHDMLEVGRRLAEEVLTVGGLLARLG